MSRTSWRWHETWCTKSSHWWTTSDHRGGEGITGCRGREKLLLWSLRVFPGLHVNRDGPGPFPAQTRTPGMGREHCWGSLELSFHLFTFNFTWNAHGVYSDMWICLHACEFITLWTHSWVSPVSYRACVCAWNHTLAVLVLNFVASRLKLNILDAFQWRNSVRNPRRFVFDM